MKTSELVDVLSTAIEPVDRSTISRTLTIALALGSALSFGGVIAILGARTEYHNWEDVAYLVAKLLFASGVLLSAAVFLLKFARPGGERRTVLPWISLPFVAVVALAGATLAMSHSSQWPSMIIGHQMWTCLLSIPFFAAIPFVLIVWALRAGAPTDLTRAGALAGLVAGGVSAAAYSLHCVDDSFPFIAAWYGLTIALCTFAGAALGPRLLRW